MTSFPRTAGVFSTDGRACPTTAVVVPIRAFVSGKSRLRGLLDEARRAELLQTMAERVVAAAAPMPVAVVSSAREVRAWAASLGITVLDDPGTLDAAAAAGVRWVAGLGLPRTVIAHADLPFARTLAPVSRDGGRPVVVAVPCHHADGTPVLSVPTGAPFAFAYGPGSFLRPAADAHTRNLGFR